MDLGERLDFAAGGRHFGLGIVLDAGFERGQKRCGRIVADHEDRVEAEFLGIARQKFEQPLLLAGRQDAKTGGLRIFLNDFSGFDAWIERRIGLQNRQPFSIVQGPELIPQCGKDRLGAAQRHGGAVEGASGERGAVAKAVAEGFDEARPVEIHGIRRSAGLRRSLKCRHVSPPAANGVSPLADLLPRHARLEIQSHIVRNP